MVGQQVMVMLHKYRQRCISFYAGFSHVGNVASSL